MTQSPLVIAAAADLDGDAVRAVAAGRSLRLTPEVRAAVAQRRREVLAALSDGTAVYGVTTGMGAQRGVRLDAEQQAAQSRRLMLARAVGGPPWLDRSEVRAVLATRLRSFLSGDAGVSLEVCDWLVALLEADVLPAIPRDGSASAGEIVPMSHAFGHLADVGLILAVNGTAVPFDAAAVPVTAPVLGAKEGVALLQGQPVASALGLLRAAEARRLVEAWLITAAGAAAVLSAPSDPYLAATARGDDVLAGVLERFRALAHTTAAAPQAPISLRVIGPVSAAVVRAADAVDAAAERALVGVTDSPAFLDGQFVGTAGFHGIDLALAMEGLRVAVLHAARVGAARLHRLLDPAQTGLPAQLSADPGPHGGLVAVHKQAAGEVQAAASLVPAVTGHLETALGQEDSQSFALAAAEQLRTALTASRSAVAAELLALHQARSLGADLGAALAGRLDAVAGVLPDGVEDRPWGRDLAALRGLLASGWPH